jgi:hypothetical protein
VHTATHYQAHCHTLLLALPHTAALPDSLSYFYLGGALAILFYFCMIISVRFHITHQVLVGLPQGVGGLAILIVIFRFSLFA